MILINQIMTQSRKNAGPTPAVKKRTSFLDEFVLQATVSGYQIHSSLESSMRGWGWSRRSMLVVREGAIYRAVPSQNPAFSSPDLFDYFDYMEPTFGPARHPGRRKRHTVQYHTAKQSGVPHGKAKAECHTWRVGFLNQPAPGVFKSAPAFQRSQTPHLPPAQPSRLEHGNWK